MPRWLNILIQAVATGGQVFNIWEPIIPPKGKPFVALGLGTAQLVVANLAHSYNPDGTPASQPYVKPEAK